MNKFRLNKIYLKNYKLFEKKEIEFDRANLIVLDGPNGYGKTSVFEAIEYLLTGNISRVEDCQGISGKIGYNTNFLAKDNTKQIIVRGELLSDKNRLIIERRIDVLNLKKIENNPKNLKNITQTKIWIDDKLIENESNEGVDRIIKQYLGENVLTNYSNFYYISQEDRLKFLMASETKRMEELRELFNVEKEIAEYNKYNSFTRLLSKKIKKMEKENLEEEEKYKQYKEGVEKQEINKKEYIDIFKNCKKKPYWNEKSIFIKDKNKLNEILEELKNASMLSRNIKQFQSSLINKKFELYMKNLGALEKLLVFHTIYENLENIIKQYNIFNHLKLLPLKVNSEEFDIEKIDYIKLDDVLELNIEIEEILKLQNEILKLRKNQSTYNKSLENLQMSRHALHTSLEEWKNAGGSEIGDNICPYCGTDFSIKKAYEDAVFGVSKILEECNNYEAIRIKELLLELKEEFDKKFRDIIQNIIEKYSYMNNPVIKDIMDNISSIKSSYIKFSSFLQEIKMDLNVYRMNLNEEYGWKQVVQEFLKKVQEDYIVELSEEYIKLQEEYHFTEIFNVTFERTIEGIPYISEETENEKRLYIQEQYQLQEYERLKKWEKDIEKNKNEIEEYENMKKDIDAVIRIYRDKIGNYQRKVIGEIQIPLYIYSGRVLQYYQGGLGVFIKSDTDVNKLETIRLLASKESEHDILYTLSSGQLTGIIIALTLTLNKIYGTDKFLCILIDDPIQTMDDLNIASLVELLRGEFKQYQMIISTHEGDFSRFIRYKYEKYKLPVKRYALNE